jgi:hypothetical protein
MSATAARRWVVVSEDSFNELCKKTTRPETESESIPPKHSASPSTPTVPEDQRPSSPTVEAHTQAENRSVKDLLPEHAWIEQLPPSYRREGLRLLRQLEATGTFDVDPDGGILIDGKLIPDYNITTFLRTASIPFHKGEFPPLLREWLRQQPEIKLRNHLARIRPVWVKKYDSRRSTTGRPQEPSEDH